jgi:2-C-methyl-D-erythritol 4-phosphate cytidylyltransferase
VGIKVTNQQKVSAIIVAAGESRRMGGIDKVFAPLSERAVISYVLDAFEKCQVVNQIIVVVSKNNVEKCRELIAKNNYSKPIEVCAGGKRRQDSVAVGLKELRDCDWVVIHDGARPLVTKELIEEGLAAARETGAAVAAVPVTDTIKTADEDRIVRQTPPRQNLWAIQTPQVFDYNLILKAYQKAEGEVTDDASLVEALGGKVKLYMGAYDNIKITTKKDLMVVEVLLKSGD